jgi:hypothetical protein
MNAAAAALLVPALLAGRVTGDAARVDREVRRSGGTLLRLPAQFAEPQRRVRVELPSAAVFAPCQTALFVGPPGVVLKLEAVAGEAPIDARSTRGLLAYSVCGGSLPSAVTLAVLAGRGAIEVRLAGTSERFAIDELAEEIRPQPDAARDRTPAVEALPPPPVEGMPALAGYRRERLEADRNGRATLEEPWIAGCRRLVVRAEESRDPADLDVIVDGPGASRWLEDRGPAAIVDRVLCTPALEPAIVRVSDANPGATVSVETAFLEEIPALAHVRSGVEAARLAGAIHAAAFAPTPRPAIVQRGVGGVTQVTVPRERGRCEGLVLIVADGRRAPRASLLDDGDSAPFLRVGDGAGLAIARCEGRGDHTLVRVDAAAAWTLASIDLGEAP